MKLILRIKYFFEKHGFHVSSRLADALGMRANSVRLFFIYISFVTLGFSFGIYLTLAFLLRLKDLIYTKRSSVFDLWKKYFILNCVLPLREEKLKKTFKLWILLYEQNHPDTIVIATFRIWNVNEDQLKELNLSQMKFFAKLCLIYGWNKFTN